jgi:hypothetical protein
MQLFIIKSLHDELPLAEIRTDGTKMDWIVDNTNGHLPRISQGSFERLQQVVQKSSHMNMEHPTESTVGMLRYLLVNGDVVEITTDGRSAKLNGKLLEDQEKTALMSLIASGKLPVKQKADIQRPMAIMPSPQKKVTPREVGPKNFSPAMKDLLKQQSEDKKAKKSRNSRHYDFDIENGHYDDDENFVKSLFYGLRYDQDDGGGDA